MIAVSSKQVISWPKGPMKAPLRSLVAALAIAAGFMSAPMSYAQTSMAGSSQIVRFESGVETVTLRGDIQGWNADKLRIPVNRGGTLSVTLESRDPSVMFNVIHPVTGAIVYDGSRQGRRASVPLPVGGDWIVEVYLERYAADAGNRVGYRLEMKLAERAPNRPNPTPPNQSSSSDYWAVSGLGWNGALNIRSEPSVNGRVVQVVTNGTVLRGNGCFDSGGTRWCAVSDPNGYFEGFASSRYLSPHRVSNGWPPVRPTPQPQPQPAVIDKEAMRKACRGAAHDNWSIPPGLILPSDVTQTRRGYEVTASSVIFNLRTTCYFDTRGNMISID